MNWKGRLSTLGCLALLASPAAAQVYYPRAGAPGCLPPPVCPTPGVPPTTTTPPSTTIPPGQQGDAFAQAPEGGTAAADSYNPAMFGDQGFFSSFSSSSNSSSSNNRLATFAALPLHATFTIAEHESPVPVSRAYINYNYYNNATHGDAGISGSDVHRETFGLEQTIGDGAASLGFRIPFLQLTGSNGFDDTQFGDIDLIFKYAVYGDRRSGDVISTGMVLTLPTASKTIAIGGPASPDPPSLPPHIG